MKTSIKFLGAATIAVTALQTASAVAAQGGVTITPAVMQRNLGSAAGSTVRYADYTPSDSPATVQNVRFYRGGYYGGYRGGYYGGYRGYYGGYARPYVNYGFRPYYGYRPYYDSGYYRPYYAPYSYYGGYGGYRPYYYGAAYAPYYSFYGAPGYGGYYYW